MSGAMKALAVTGLLAAVGSGWAMADPLVLPPPGYSYKSAAGCPFDGKAYAPCDDQMQRLATAVGTAKADGKVLLIVLGADWCPWCRSLEKLIPSADVLARKDPEFDFAGRFAFTNIAVSALTGGKRVSVPSGIAVDDLLIGSSGAARKTQGIPYLVVLDPASGRVYHRDTGDLEDAFNVEQTHDVAKLRQALRTAYVALRP